MTAQFSDLVYFNNQLFELTDIEGDDLFHPAQHDMLPVSTCTACWRGFVSTFEVVDEQLFLKNLDINLEKKEKRFFWSDGLPRINKVKPAESDSLYGLFDFHFQDIGLKVPFTGWLLIGEGFIEELYVHMGFHPAWKYNTVYKLTFDIGKLKKSSNVSDAMKKFREQNNSQEEGDADSRGKEPDSWIEEYLKTQ